MPRLSLWQNGKHDHDYRFIDRQVSEQFTIGGTSMLVHKLLGTADNQGSSSDPSQPVSDGILGIQDLLFLENRDRKYETDVYELRGHYNTQDNDLSNEQFGAFLTNDNLYLTFHINDMVERIGRKILPGDVLELPHLIDYWDLNDGVPVALKKFYVVDDASRAGEGYSPTWWPHLWRIKVKPMTDSQEYSAILNQIQEGTDVDGNGDQTLRDLLSVYNTELVNNAAVIAAAEAEVPQSGYDTSQFYVMDSDSEGNPGEPEDYTDPNGVPQSATTPQGNGWTDGYLTGDGLAPNGYAITSGTEFSSNPVEGEYFLRLDYLPNRLFRYSGSRWVKIEDTERTSMTPGDGLTLRDTFVNNDNTTTADDNIVLDERVALSKALTPSEDN